VDSIPGQVKPKTIKLTFAASLISTHYKGIRADRFVQNQETYLRHSMASVYILYIYLILSQSNENLKSKIPRRQNIFKIRSDNSGNKDKFDIRRT
jgi:hypothetical protein